MTGQHIRALKSGRWVHAIDCGDETVLLLAEDVATGVKIDRGRVVFSQKNGCGVEVEA